VEIGKLRTRMVLVEERITKWHDEKQRGSLNYYPKIFLVVVCLSVILLAVSISIIKPLR